MIHPTDQKCHHISQDIINLKHLWHHVCLLHTCHKRGAPVSFTSSLRRRSIPAQQIKIHTILQIRSIIFSSHLQMKHASCTEADPMEALWLLCQNQINLIALTAQRAYSVNLSQNTTCTYFHGYQDKLGKCVD